MPGPLARSNRRRTPLAGLAILCAILLGGCVAPMADEGAYRVDALRTVQSARGSVSTSLLTVQAVLDDRTFDTSADVVATQAVDDLSAVTGTFGSIEPPVVADPLREEVEALLTEASTACGDALIGVRRGDPARLREAESALQEAGEKLDELEDELSGESSSG